MAFYKVNKKVPVRIDLRGECIENACGYMVYRKSAEECRIGVVESETARHGKAITQVASVRPSKCFASQHIALKSGVMGVEWQPAAC